MFQDHLHREIHVWFAQPDHVTNPASLEQYRAILSTQETTRYRRFHFPADSQRYLIAHALLRNTLSKYADLPPTSWTFTQGTHGRPEISNPEVAAIRFNLTHTKGLVGCVVTLENDCGIDAEALSSRHDLSGIAQRMFSVDESRELQRLKGSVQLDYFFARWTLREAYVKAQGIGISFPTRKLTFTVNKDSSAEVLFHPDIEDQGENWRFELLKPTAEHIAALAIRRNGDIEKKIVTRFIEF